MSGGRICLFAQYHPQQRIRPHVVEYVRQLQECGYRTVVACSGNRLPPLEDREALYATGAELVLRPNEGLDFGAWGELIREGYTDGAEAVLLANDSVFGPFRPLAPIFARMNRRYDVWGMIESLQHRWHLQSWFLHFTGDAFRRPAVQEVLNLPFVSMPKNEIIERGELGLGAALEAEGLRCGAVVGLRHASWAARMRPVNGMHVDWHHNLVSGRMPFLKADLLRTNGMNLPWVRRWAQVLRDRLGVDPRPISDYLYDYTGKIPKTRGPLYAPPVRPIPFKLLAAYVLLSRDHRLAWRAVTAYLRSELYGDHA